MPLSARRGGRDAEQELERQEREAVRSVEGQGHVEGAGSSDRELAGFIQPRRQELRLRLIEVLVLARRDDRAEEGRRPQGRQGNRAQEFLTLRNRVDVKRGATAASAWVFGPRRDRSSPTPHACRQPASWRSRRARTTMAVPMVCCCLGGMRVRIRSST